MFLISLNLFSTLGLRPAELVLSRGNQDIAIKTQDGFNGINSRIKGARLFY